MFKEIFEGIINFADSLSATGSVLIALILASVMFLLKLGTRKGEHLQNKIRIQNEEIEKIIEQATFENQENILSLLLESYPVQAYLTLNRLGRKDLITSRLRWRFIGALIIYIIIFLCFVALFGSIALALI